MPTHLTPDKRTKMGIGYVPQGREIFSKLTVYENLLIGLEARTDGLKKLPTDMIYELFPILADFEKRLGGKLEWRSTTAISNSSGYCGRPQSYHIR